MMIRITLEIDAVEVKQLPEGNGLAPCARIVYADGRSFVVRDEDIVSIKNVEEK